MRTLLRADRLAIPALAFALAPVAVMGQQGARLTDAEIAHVAVTANEIDIDAAELTRGRAQSPAVKEFAEALLRDHSAVVERATAWAQQAGVSPTANSLSQELRIEADKETAKFDDLAGLSFDRSYIAREVAYHREVLYTIDDVLLPQTTNAELRRILTEVRPTVEAHLHQAQAIKSELAAQ